jgi:hypothetical protein
MKNKQENRLFACNLASYGAAGKANFKTVSFTGRSFGLGTVEKAN